MTKLTAIQVSSILNIGVPRLSAWYNWYRDDKFVKPDSLPALPEYEQNGPHTPRYWHEKDVPKLQEFQKFIGRGRAGIMGEHSARSWQERGRRALENKGRNDLVEEYFNKE